MKSTITLIPDERVVSIFKKVAGSFSNKFSSQLLEIVLNSLKSKYIEKYLQAKSIVDVEKVDEQLSSEINTLLKTKDVVTFRDSYNPLRSPYPGILPYTPPYVSPIEKNPYNITCLYNQA